MNLPWLPDDKEDVKEKEKQYNRCIQITHSRQCFRDKKKALKENSLKKRFRKALSKFKH